MAAKVHAPGLPHNDASSVDLGTGEDCRPKNVNRY